MIKAILRSFLRLPRGIHAKAQRSQRVKAAIPLGLFTQTLPWFPELTLKVNPGLIPILNENKGMCPVRIDVLPVFLMLL